MWTRTLSATACAVAAAAILWTAPMYAQESATLVMRSGDRIGGELIDLGGVGFTIRVNGQERRIQPSEVSVIDFNGAPPSPEAQAKINAGAQFVMLRNGQTIDGSLYDIGGTSPLRITLDTSSGQRNITSNEVAQIYMAGSAASARAAVASPGLTAPGAPGPGQTITVPANQQWTATGINVRKGQVLNLTTSGEIQFSPDASDRAAAAGNGNKKVPGSPMPNEFAGALIGRIGNSQAFGVGNLSSLTAPAQGQLFLGVNDDNVGDNAGQFQVSIQVARR